MRQKLENMVLAFLESGPLQIIGAAALIIVSKIASNNAMLLFSKTYFILAVVFALTALCVRLCKRMDKWEESFNERP